MSLLTKYFSEIGRRGGIRSRRVLSTETARRMVAIREARRLVQRVQPAARPEGTPADTASAAQVVQDALLSRFSPVEKLARVARFSRMVDLLSVQGLRQRHADADDEVIRYLRAELRLGPELAARVYGHHPDDA